MSAPEVLDLARDAGHRIATAESCTGGMLAAALSAVPGASDVLMGGLVTYSNAAKVRLLGVSREALEAQGAVSEQVAREMAEGALRSLPEATLSLSITGIAGPGGSDHKPEGRVCFGLAMSGRVPWVETVDFGPLGRDGVRQAATDHALALIAGALRALD